MSVTLQTERGNKFIEVPNINSAYLTDNTPSYCEKYPGFLNYAF